MNDAKFLKLIQDYYRRHGRHDLPWRKSVTPYKVLVSEVMLQQTQVPRVREKYRMFLAAFPSFRSLAQASRADVIRLWQGLGYNRRALALQRCAQEVVARHHGRLPRSFDALVALPGIGPYTAGAILAFAFDVSWPLIETNVRRVYIHHYFPSSTDIADAAILPIVTRHLKQISSAREWFSALMDYGTHLAQITSNPNRRSRHYVRQATFEGSLRQVRGAIVRALAHQRRMRRSVLERTIDDARFAAAVEALTREGAVEVVGSWIQLAQ